MQSARQQRKPWGGHTGGHTGHGQAVTRVGTYCNRWGTPVCYEQKRLTAGGESCCGPHPPAPPQTGGSEGLLPGRHWESWTACFSLEFSEIILEKPNVCFIKKCVFM